MQLTRIHRILIGVVAAGAVIIAAIGFAGSYTAVRELAQNNGFGQYSLVFPIGIDAGICVLLALDLLLTWIRIPFPLLRPTAWLLTTATIAFNGAAAWPDPLGTGMHAVIPLLFVVTVEAARHAVGRIADITADKHIEGIRLTRWLLSPLPTLRLWRRMKLWELRSYEQAIKLEQDRLIYQTRLHARYGRAWRRKAPIQALMPLRLAKYGIPLTETAPTAPTGLAGLAGLAAARTTPKPLPPKPATPAPELEPAAEEQPSFAAAGRVDDETDPAYAAAPWAQHDRSSDAVEAAHHSKSSVDERPWFRKVPEPSGTYESASPRHFESVESRPAAVPAARQQPQHPLATVRIPPPVPGPLDEPARERVCEQQESDATQTDPASAARQHSGGPQPTTVDRYYQAWAGYVAAEGRQPTDGELSEYLAARSMTGRGGRAISPSTIRRYLPEFRIYAAWEQHLHLHLHGDEPTAEQLSRNLADTGTTGRPYSAEKITEMIGGFPRRRAAISQGQTP
ncbi:DUF2637 domain-containing protein [Streptomyces wuyuanensis]|uniref:DUF2637 domain-containing protein n=1 Tax=Streptomyces wuyuanensis TaxID=1196353 RepID=UPI003690383E